MKTDGGRLSFSSVTCFCSSHPLSVISVCYLPTVIGRFQTSLVTVVAWKWNFWCLIRVLSKDSIRWRELSNQISSYQSWMQRWSQRAERCSLCWSLAPFTGESWQTVAHCLTWEIMEEAKSALWADFLGLLLWFPNMSVFWIWCPRVLYVFKYLLSSMFNILCMLRVYACVCIWVIVMWRHCTCKCTCACVSLHVEARGQH